MKRFLRSNALDLLLSFLTSFVMNLLFIYSLIKYREPIYLHLDELIWIKQVDFCGGNFFFFEQKWGLIVPLLCIMYPLKFFIPLYYFSILRIFIIFLEAFLLLKFLRLVFRKKSSIFFVYFSHFSGSMVGVNFIYFIIRAILGKAEGFPSFHELVFDYIFDIPGDFLFWELLRIFNPVYFMIFLIAFSIFFIKFLEQKKNRKYKFFAGLFLGLLFYSTVYWWLYVCLSVALFLIYYVLKVRKDLREIIEVIVIGMIVGIPAIVFNYWQLGILQDGIKRAAMLVGVQNSLSLLVLPRGYIIFFIISFTAFLIARNFSEKSVFLLISAFCGIILLFVEPLTGIYLQMAHHIWFMLKFFNRIVLGFLLEKMEDYSRVLAVILASIMFFGFLISWGKFFVDNRDSYHNRDLSKILQWINRSTDKNDVIAMEDISGYDGYAQTEIRLSLTSRYVFHVYANYFSDLKDWEVFERFILKEKLLGSDIGKISKVNCSFLGLWDITACFGLPKSIDISDFSTADSYFRYIIGEAQKFLSDEKYIKSLMRKYKIDYIIRRKPKGQSETYLHPITQIEDFYIYKFEFQE